jgi:hypothetical protein
MAWCLINEAQGKLLPIPKIDYKINNIYIYIYIYIYIQSVLGGKVSILGGHIIGHSKQICIHTCICLIPNGFRDRAISLYSSKTVDKKDILRTVSNTGVYCSSGKVGTVYLV